MHYIPTYSMQLSSEIGGQKEKKFAPRMQWPIQRSWRAKERGFYFYSTTTVSFVYTTAALSVLLDRQIGEIDSRKRSCHLAWPFLSLVLVPVSSWSWEVTRWQRRRGPFLHPTPVVSQPVTSLIRIMVEEYSRIEKLGEGKAFICFYTIHF